jgi:3-dehydroquinate synthase
MTRAVPVALDGRAYDVVIGRDLIDQAGARLNPLLKRPLAAVVMDGTIERLHGPRLLAALTGSGIEPKPIVIAPGEAAKSFAGLEALMDELLACELDRGDLIVAFGGGVVGDLAGFAAAIYKRGVDFVQIPTTLLSQVDSSVGGKTAIDTPRGKNLVGAFHQPRLVLADIGLLDSLPDREMRCGFAEVVKYGLLGDENFFAWLEVHGEAVLARDEAALTHAVGRSVEMKAEIVAADEREGGVRALLNLGHTFGHALETACGHGDELKHGEAVALGCVMAFRYSARRGLCTDADSERVARLIAMSGLPTRLSDIDRTFDAERLLANMAQDKKAKAGRLTFILVRGIGQAFVANDVDPAALRAFLIEEGATP